MMRRRREHGFTNEKKNEGLKRIYITILIVVILVLAVITASMAVPAR